MLQERLELAHQLLSSDGAIFISIDDNEYAYLKVLMDEIFGEVNFIASFVGRKKTKTNDSKYFSITTEYILLYAKQKNNLKVNRNHNIDHTSYAETDQFLKTRGKYKLAKLDNRSHTYSQKLDYEFNYHDQKIYPGGNYQLWLKRQKGDHAKKDGQGMWAKQTILTAIKNNQVILKDKKIYTKRYGKVDYKLQPIARSEPYDNLITDSSFLNYHGNKLLVEILNKKEFDHPKPLTLIKGLINLIDKRNPIVLDFFAGSGTTGHAVLDLNREDKGNRKFILVTNNENNIGTICYERLHRIIKGEGTKREINFAWHREHDPYCGELCVYHVKTKGYELNPEKNERFNLKLANIINQISIAYQELNPDFKSLISKKDEDEGMEILLQLTINSGADNKEI